METQPTPLLRSGSNEAVVALQRFKAYATSHPLLSEVDKQISRAIDEPAGFAFVLLYGPTHEMCNEVNPSLARKRLAKRVEMCLLKRKETGEYFLRRRLYDQYGIISSEYPDLATISSLNAIVAGRSSDHGALPHPSRSA